MKIIRMNEFNNINESNSVEKDIIKQTEDFIRKKSLYPSDITDILVECAKRAVEYALPQYRRQIVDKAVEWMENNINDYIINDTYTLPNGKQSRDWLKVKSDCFDDFKKAMDDNMETAVHESYVPNEDMIVNPTAGQVVSIIGTSKEKLYLVVKTKSLPIENPDCVRDYITIWYAPNGYGNGQYIYQSGWENNRRTRFRFDELQDMFDDIIDYGYEIVWLKDQENAVELFHI